MSNNIKRGASLYSFQEEYFLRKMSLEDIIATCEKLDIPGIEIIGEQMAPGFPEPGDEFFENWHKWMDKYGRTPVCHDMFLDWNKHKGRTMTLDEQVQSMVRDLKFANRLGATVIRAIHTTDLSVLERSVPYAEEYNVKMGVEIHAPNHVDHPAMQRLWELMERLDSPYLGFTPDMGIFTRRMPRVVSDRWLRNGARKDVVDHIIDVYNSHERQEQLPEDVEKMGGGPEDVAAAGYASRAMIWSEPRSLLKIMPRMVHIHAKFNEMLPDYTEYSIPYDEIIPVLIEGGYNGYLSSEYEGNRHIQDAFEVDSVEQVRRQQMMFKRLLGEEETSGATVAVAQGVTPNV
jgi:sugar phosphate isomerase/epimerase